jgi:hypothetical protein
MSEKEAMLRGLKFGWDNIFAQENGEDLGKLGQGIHALQDAFAHEGAKTNDHLGKNFQSVGMLVNDMYGSTKKAASITKSALIVSSLVQGKKVNLRDGDTLNFTGMTSEQLSRVMRIIMKRGFEGRLTAAE